MSGRRHSLGSSATSPADERLDGAMALLHKTVRPRPITHTSACMMYRLRLSLSSIQPNPYRHGISGVIDGIFRKTQNIPFFLGIVP